MSLSFLWVYTLLVVTTKKQPKSSQKCHLFESRMTNIFCLIFYYSTCSSWREIPIWIIYTFLVIFHPTQISKMRYTITLSNSTLHDKWLMVDYTSEGDKKARVVVHSMLGHHEWAKRTSDDPALNGPPQVLFYRPQACYRPSTTRHEALNCILIVQTYRRT